MLMNAPLDYSRTLTQSMCFHVLLHLDTSLQLFHYRQTIYAAQHCEQSTPAECSHNTTEDVKQKLESLQSKWNETHKKRIMAEIEQHTGKERAKLSKELCQDTRITRQRRGRTKLVKKI